MGQNPPTLNILNSEINRLEYIEVFSLLAKAADMIADGETCVELNRYEDGPIFEGGVPRQSQPQQHPQQPGRTKPEAPTKEPKAKKPWSKWAEKLKGLMTEDDNEDDQ